MKSRVIDESYKWGANLLEIYRGGFPLETEAGWTAESTADLLAYAHARGMRVQWFPHTLGKPTFSDARQALIDLMQSQFDGLDTEPARMLDGLGTEQWTTITPEIMNLCAWSFHPGLYIYTNNHRFSVTLPNELDSTASNGLGCDDQTTGYYELPERLMKKGGLQYWGNQAECRFGVNPKAGYLHRFGGLGSPDWILKQCNDQFRVRARNRGEKPTSPTAMWWINEVIDVCPKENRRYVYGISQDPIRCAVTARLSNLGEEPMGFRDRALPQRFDYPSQTAFLQNNYLRLYHLHDRDEAILLRDPERSAQYDGNSRAEVLSEHFCRTDFPDHAPGNLAEVAFDFVEPAGYESALQARLTWDNSQSEIRETRTFRMWNDSPFVRIRIDRRLGQEPLRTETVLGISHYDTLTTQGQARMAGSSLEIPAEGEFRLSDSSNAYPDLYLLVLSRGQAHTLRFEPRESIVLEFTTEQQQSTEFLLAMPDGVYRRDEVPHWLSFLRSPQRNVQLDERGAAKLANPWPVPLVEVIRVHGGGKDPYQVQEFGRWSTRGAHPSLEHENVDYLKCYLPPSGTVHIQRRGWIDGAVRQGWGCQYTVGIDDARTTTDGCEVKAAVRSVTPLLFAPSLEFRKPIGEVRLDGKAWSYFDGRQVMLPQKVGSVRVEVESGQRSTPHLASTFASVSQCSWQDEQLIFEAEPPPWTDWIPDTFHFTGLVRHPGYRLVRLEGGNLLRGQDEASIVRFRPGRVALTFENATAPVSVAQPTPVSQKILIEEACRRDSLKYLRPYLEHFSPEQIRYEEVSANPESIADCHVLVCYSWFLEEPPPSWDALIGPLREWGQNGGNLLLIADGAKLWPRLAGYETPEVDHTFLRNPARAGYQSHGLWRYCEQMGLQLTPTGTEHPIFQGLDYEDEVARRVALLRPGFFELITWLPWASVEALDEQGRPLATMYAQFAQGALPASFEPATAIWESSLGNGKCLAYLMNLRYLYGSLDRTYRSKNEVRLIHNAVRYLGEEKSPLRIGILW
jgi:hypothetical protein